jgi:hypothetical protein
MKHVCQLLIEDKSRKTRPGKMLLTWCGKPAYEKIENRLGLALDL